LRNRARQLAARLVHRAAVEVVFRRDLTRPIPEAAARVPLIAAVASREEVLGEIARLRPDPALPELFAGRLERGFGCFVGRVDGRLVAYNWTQYEPGEDDGAWIDLGPGEVHCLDAYTVEDLRGRNIHAALLREMLLFNAGLGYRHAYSATSVSNRSSRKGLRRLGWEQTGSFLQVRRRSGLAVVRLTGSAHPWKSFSAARS
jgi:GNAT superfamily N-acetyltransferase